MSKRAALLSMLGAFSMTESYQGNYLSDEDALSVYCDAGATATIKLVSNTLTLTKDGTPTAIDLTQDANDTLGELVAVINALENWNATLLGISTKASKDLLVDMVETSCLLIANAQTLKTIEQDVSNWTTAWVAIQKKQLIQEEEALLEKITHDFFYPKAFIRELDGNNKNRLFLGFIPNILSVTKIEIYGVEINTSYWTHDEYSVYIDLENVAAGQAELKRLLKETEIYALFPRGIKNIRVTGTYGWNSCPHEIRRAVIMMIEEFNDPTLYDHWIKGSQSVGKDFSYTNPEKVYTGIVKVDQILKRYIRKRIGLQA